MAREFAIRNPDKLLENMVLLRDVLASRGARCFLHYGTLLGAIRERGFIPHDDDADLGVFDVDFDAILGAVPELVGLGFSFNSQRHGRLLQFTRDGEQVDLFVAVKVRFPMGHRWAIDERISVSPSYLDTLGKMEFLGHTFYVPSRPEALMLELYGKTWMTPMKNVPSKTGITWKLSKLLREPLKSVYFVKRFLGTQKRKSRGEA